MSDYDDILTAAMEDIAEHGYDSQDRVFYWAEALKKAALNVMMSDAEVSHDIRERLLGVFGRAVVNGDILKYHPGVTPFTLQQMRPELHAELQRRIHASVDLIKLNREQAIERTMRRFQGWATSVPVGGSRTVDKRAEKKTIRKSMTQLSFQERRVAIDQGAKLFSAINTTVAVNSGAIGGVWQSHKNQKGYNGRKEHNARDGKFFLVRDSWAIKSGLVKKAKYSYTDEIEQPGEFVFCRCSWQYLYSLRSVPKECLTKKGETFLATATAKVKAALQEA